MKHLKRLANVDQLRVGILIIEHGILAEITYRTDEGIKIKTIKTNTERDAKPGLIPLKQIQDAIDQAEHEIFIIGLKEDNPEYYL